jgi:hypothetical protein
MRYNYSQFPQIEPLYQPRHDIDWKRFPSVIFESDDWGACENSKDLNTAAKLAEIWHDLYKKKKHSDSTLESINDLENLYLTLERFQGVDGLPAVFTAFACVGNPDYQAIRENGFTEYKDIGIDSGVPAGWERGNLPQKWREGITRGVFAPEFHANLHHTSPVLLMERLKALGKEGEVAKKAFDLSIYSQGVHLPEYDGMNVREQHKWVKTGVERFVRAVGYIPSVAVTSDAYPITETIWSINGIRVVSLKNSKLNSGEIVVYGNKPWNNQDVYTPLGGYNEVDDLVYLSRNVWFEQFLTDESQNAEAVLRVSKKRWEENEPAIISTHRIHYASLNKERMNKSLAELKKLLSGFVMVKGVHFLTSAELGSIYRNGWSIRQIGKRRILRKWSSNSPEIRIKGKINSITSIPERRDYSAILDGEFSVCKLPVGDYIIDIQKNEQQNSFS